LLECSRKKAVSGVYWNINFFLLAVQAAIAVGVIVAARYYGYLKELKPLEVKKLLRWLPLAIINFLAGYLSLKALQCLSLPTYIILTNVSILTTVYVSHLLGESTSTTAVRENMLPAVLLITASVFTNIYTDGNYAEVQKGDKRMIQTLEPYLQDPVTNLWFGYLYVAGTVGLNSLYEVLKGKWGRKFDLRMGSLDTIYYNALLALPILTFISYFVEDFREENMNDNFPATTKPITILCIAYSGLGVFPVEHAKRVVRKISSKAYTNVLEQTNKGIMALIAMWVFGTVAGLGSLMAVVMAATGAVVWNWGTLGEREKREVLGVVKEKGKWKGKGIERGELPI